MKKLLMVLLGLLLITGMAKASFLGPMGSVITSNDEKLYRQTMPLANTIYPVTLEAGSTASINMQAIGGDVRRCIAATTTEAYWTIGQSQTFFDHIPLQYGINKVLYFWTTSTSTPEIQIHLNYR